MIISLLSINTVKPSHVSTIFSLLSMPFVSSLLFASNNFFFVW